MENKVILPEDCKLFHAEDYAVITLLKLHVILVTIIVGSNMLSGGQEGVLVMWQYKTHHQEFLPRLGAPINHLAVSPDDSLTAVSQNENGKLVKKNEVSFKIVTSLYAAQMKIKF